MPTSLVKLKKHETYQKESPLNTYDGKIRTYFAAKFFHLWKHNFQQFLKNFIYSLRTPSMYPLLKTVSPQIDLRVIKHYCVWPRLESWVKKQKDELLFDHGLFWLSRNCDVWKRSNWKQHVLGLMAILFSPNRSPQCFYKSHKRVYEALMGSWQPWLPTVIWWKAVLHSFGGGLWLRLLGKEGH